MQPQLKSLYVHIPFCASKCAYCDFYSLGRADIARMEAFVNALLAEWSARQHLLTTRPDTIYIGGGTPSQLPSQLLEHLLNSLPECVGEFTVEVNPEDVTPALTELLAASSVNRVSMGVQSLDNQLLRLIGRRHTAARVYEAVDALRQAGITNICLDLIYGIPSQTQRMWADTLQRTLGELRPSHLSAYSLTYEPHTRLWAMRQAGKIAETPEDTVVEMYHTLCLETAAYGMTHYEISNFALPGFEARHNSGYWDVTTSYLGLGPGAHSCINGLRSHNPADLRGYLTARPGTFTIDDPEDETDRHNDCLITALRTARGIDRSLLPPHADKYLADGRMAALPDGRVRITEQAWLTSDAIIVDLMR